MKGSRPLGSIAQRCRVMIVMCSIVAILAAIAAGVSANNENYLLCAINLILIGANAITAGRLRRLLRRINGNGRRSHDSPPAGPPSTPHP